MSEFLSKVVYLTPNQYNSLLLGQTIGGQTFDPSALYITNTPGDADDAATVNGHTVQTDVPPNAHFDADTWRPIGNGADDAAAGNHTHGNITNDGKINQTSNWALQNGDGLIVFDANNSNKLERTGITFDASDETKILSKKGSWVNFVSSIGGQTGNVTLANLGLSNALHFVGTTTSTLSENATTSPIIINSNNYTPSQGDVVLASDAEYLWNGSRWDLLGDASSFKKVQTAVNTATAETTEATTFVHSVTQNSEGVITVKTRDLDTTGVWSGTATAWTNNRKVYADLTNASTTTEINGNSSASASAIGIGVNGTLGISNGGTGNTTFTQDCIITYTSNSKLESRGLKVTGATDKDVIITPYATNKNLTINANGTGTATFKSTSGAMEISTTTGAMTISTTTGNLTIESTSTGNVELTNTSTGKVTVSAKYGSLILQSNTASLTLGNNIASGTTGASKGTITLYSTSTAAHIIDGESTTTDYTHTFPNKTGYIVIGSTANIGSDTGPVYLSNGELIECASVVQTADFTLTGVSGAGSATIGSDTTISSNTEVIQISIAYTTASYLNSPISWTITNNRIVLSASVTTGKAVTGKIYFVKNSA